jgi:hypothetical protein
MPAATPEPTAQVEDEPTVEPTIPPTAMETPGEMAQLFQLPNADGDLVSLESYRGDKNVVLVFYRGFW